METFWESFRLDPRQPGHASMRASDADREIVRVVLGTMLHVNYMIEPSVQGTATLQTSAPLRPFLNLTSAIREVRVMFSPTRKGRWNSARPPAHMRRGKSTGGRNPPRLA